MGVFRSFWNKLTRTQALEQSSGKLETLFFESVYRVAYLLGNSTPMTSFYNTETMIFYIRLTRCIQSDSKNVCICSLPIPTNIIFRSDTQTGHSTTDRNIGYLIYSTAVKLTIALLICGEIWYMLTKSTSIDELVGNVNTTFIQFIAVYRYKNMMDNKTVYKRLAVSMESPNFDISTDTRKSLVKFWANRSEKYLRLLLILGNCTLFTWYVYPLTDDIEYNLVVGLRLPFQFESSLRYSFVYIWAVISFMYSSHFIMITDLIMQAHLMHLICQFTVLSDCFLNLFSDCRVGFEGTQANYLIYNKSFQDKYLKRLGNLVTQHKAILGHAMNLKETLSRPMLGQLTVSGIMICSVGYQATTTISETYAKGVMSLLFLGYNGFQMYIICRWCEEITVQSQKIGESIYSSGWESGVGILPGVKSTITLVIARANKPLVFTAGGMYNLSLTSYSTLVKTSYSALTVLLRFRHD